MIYSPKSGRFMAMEPVSLNSSPADIRSYWTPERKAAAIHAEGSGPEFTGIPGAENAPPPPPAADPKPANLAEMPFRTGGKLFYSMNGKDFVASANIFMRNNMLLTAAHCIQDKTTGNVGDKFIFELNYSGESSSEDFTVKTVALRENWYLKKDVKYDYAIAILDKSSNVPEPLRYSLEDIWNKKVTSMGYPVDYSLGAQMMFTQGPAIPLYGHWAMFGSKMGPGSSGGAWVLEDNVSVVGLNAYVSRSGREILYSGSPKFDDEFVKLYEYALKLI